MKLKEKYTIVLVSNFFGNIETVLQDFKLNDLFSDIIESSVVGVRRPDPQIFNLGIIALSEKPENIIVIGDSFSKDIQPAASLGCQTIWIKKISWDDKEDQINHDNIITDFSELNYLLSL